MIGTTNNQNKLVKECIYEAFMILLEQKDFTDISITEITQKAGVSRMAYYRNYHSKEDIIIKHLDELFSECAKLISQKEKEIFIFSKTFFSYFKNHQNFLKNIIKAELTFLLMNRFGNYMEILYGVVVHDNCKSKDTESKYLPHLIAGGLNKILIEWAINDFKESEEELASLMRSYFKKGS